MRVRTLPASLTPTASPAPARESVMTLPPGLRRNVRTGGPAPAIKAAAGGGRHCAAEQAAAVAACGPAVPLPAPSRRLSLSLFLSPSLSSPFSFFSSPSPFPSPPPPLSAADMPRVYIGRLSYHVREKDIQRFFSGYGRLLEVDLKNG